MSEAVQCGASSNLDDLLREVTSIPGLPEVTARVVAAVEDPNTTARQIHGIIVHDPALVTQILKVVNSAFYGLPGRVGSIDRAVALLGVRGIKNIALAASVGLLFDQAPTCGGFAPRDLWVHSIAVAVAARELARDASPAFADEAFLAGLIHDIGLLAMLHVRPAALREVCEAGRHQPDDFCALERRIVGFDHQALGMALLARWRFPRGCQRVAGHHHRPQDLGEECGPPLTWVHVADTLCCAAGYGFHLTAASQTLTDETLARLRVGPASISNVRERLDGLVREAVALLE